MKEGSREFREERDRDETHHSSASHSGSKNKSKSQMTGQDDVKTRRSTTRSSAEDLVVLLGLGRLGRQEPAVAAVLVLLVRDRDLVQVGEDVLHLGVGVAALGAAQVVEPRPLVEEEVDDGDDDRDTDRVTPDDDDGDDAGVAVLGEVAVVVEGV